MKNSITNKQLRDFGFLIAFGFPLLIGWILPAIGGHEFRLWTVFLGITSLILGAWKPTFLFYPYKGWIALGDALGWMNSRIILGLVFIFVLQPISLVMRIFGYDPLRKRKRNLNYYRENKKDHKIDLTRIF